MAKITYDGKEISHTEFIALCRKVGINGGYFSTYEVLQRIAKEGNKKAIEIISKLTYE